ncbi:flavoprotein [Dietzia sp. HMSC21D01]|uniref:NAD(P)H-dependent oxidoreductase n=1 Tax=Dietzia cinnamea TaxID=321318 RepID=A0AAW5QC49_9ACTN|nr:MULTISPECIES: CE1759 family FMN reductase [Dietzia]AVM63106.1 flavoprotein [Dietzia sp. oral taxon 368]MCT1712331.1 NAD(P)H-dependent oxidoreductase [Dietzia cinnamea]MCT1864315.1 NAD(P)H-dependent oxidoreductase [Dietzia cinnamea]MCT2030639.1 NAD(P)H-dependent oxidoreductase [Dietzia cinnamea]MCT2034964.1 NAD(P)H-dependent oxidoreductase [Dietzia cinnamea]
MSSEHLTDHTAPDERSLNLVVVAAGTSVPSSTRMLADQLTSATRDALARHGQRVEVTVLEARELAHEVVDATVTRFPGEKLSAAIDAIGRADGLIAVTPIYNQSFSGLFKSLFDVIEPGTLAGVPVALGATGGTARHSLAVDYAVRPMFAYLKADVVPTTVFAAAEDFGAVSTAGDENSLRTRAVRVGTELGDYMLRFAGVTAGAVEPTRADDKRGRRDDDDEFSDFVPMGDLLGR